MMTTENEPPFESMEDEYQWAREKTLEVFQLAKNSMNKTFQKHPEECTIILDIKEKYYCNRKVWKNLNVLENSDCLFLKLNDIYDLFGHIYLLLLSGRYNIPRILLRKWIELVVISIYFDTVGKGDPKRDKFLKVEDMKSPGFTHKLKKLQGGSCNDDILKLYQKLSLYTHNEGKKYGQSSLAYNEKEFEEVYSAIIDIQSYLEKIIYKNCNIKI